MVAAIGISALVQIFTDAVQVTIGILAIYFMSERPGSSIGAASIITAWFGWLGLGGLGLLRFAPSTRESPQWLMRFGVPDFVCIALIIVGLTIV